MPLPFGQRQRPLVTLPIVFQLDPLGAFDSSWGFSGTSVSLLMVALDNV